MSSKPVLVVDRLTKTYRVYRRPHNRVQQAIADRFGWDRTYSFEVPAVSEVSLDLKRGQALAIIGRNGSGKSTLLQMIAGTLHPTSGSSTMAGRVSALLELGAGFNPDFTGRQNFRISAAIQGLSDSEIAAVEPKVEAFAEVGPFFDEPVRTYSSGMYVRVAFAAAVHVKPDLLIVDEALAVGDVFFQQKCFAYIQNELGDTAKLIVTHDLTSAVRLTDRCIVMDQGKVVFDGPPLEAVETYTALSLQTRSTRLGSAPAAAVAQAAPTVNDGELAAEQELRRMEVEQYVADLSEVPAERSSSPEVFKVVSIGATAGENELKLLDPEAPIVHPGERVQIRMLLDVALGVDRPIIGYLIRDRVGNALFGQNSIGSAIKLDSLRPGRQYVTFDILWPEVEHGDYFLTIGLGDGAHPLHHDILAWAQSVLRFVSSPRRPVHGAFNNDIYSMQIDSL